MSLVPLLLAATTFLLGPETSIEPPGVDSYTNNGAPSVAAAGSGFLAVWPTKPVVPDPTVSIYAMPFDQNAQPLQQTAQFITHAAAPPGIASSPDDSLIAWAGSGGIRAAHVSHLGIPLKYVALAPERPGFHISGGRTRVSWDGSRYIVASTGRAQSTRFGPITNSVLVAVEGGETTDFGPGSVVDAASASGRTLLLMLDNDKLTGRFVGDSTPFVIVGNGVRDAALASDGFTFHIFITTLDGAMHADIDLGAALRNEQFWPGTGVGFPANPSLTWDGRFYVVAYPTSETGYAVGPVNQLHQAVPTRGGFQTALAANGSTLAFVSGGSVVEATTLPNNTRRVLSLVQQQQLQPLLNERNLFYIQTPEQTLDALRVAGDGVLSADVIAYDANGSAVAVREGNRIAAGRGGAWRFTAQADGRLVAVASAGEVDLVAWQRGNAVFAALDSEFQLSRGEGQPPRSLRATWNGSAFVVVWEEPQPAVFDGWLLKKALVHPDGTRSDEQIVMTLPLGGEVRAISGDLIAWTLHDDELHILGPGGDAFIGHYPTITRVQFVDEHLFWTSRFDLFLTTHHLRLGGTPEQVMTTLATGEPVFNRSLMAYPKLEHGVWRVVYRTWSQVTRRRVSSR